MNDYLLETANQMNIINPYRHAVTGGGFDKSNLVAWYDLNETSGTVTTMVDDHAGLNLTASGSPPGNQARGTHPSGIGTSGVEFQTLDYGGVANAAFEITGDLTIGAWVYFDTLASSRGVVSKTFGTTGQSYAIYVNLLGKVVFYISPTGTYAASYELHSTTALNAGEWYFITCTYKTSTSKKIYINGALDAVTTTSVPASINLGNDDFEIGRQYDTGANNSMDGMILSAFIASREYTESEIAVDLYNGGRGRTYASLAAATPTPDWVTENHSMITLWDMEGTTLTATMGNDQIATSHLDDGGVDTYPAADTVDFKLGTQSARMYSAGTDDLLGGAMSSLDSRFPCYWAGGAGFTICGWLMPSSAGPNYIATYSSGINRFQVLSSSLGAKIYGSGGNVTTTTPSWTFSSVARDTWAFVAVTYSDAHDKITLYMREEADIAFNTHEDTANIGTLTYQSGDFILGAAALTGGFSTNHNFDGFAVFNKALTEGELNGIFDNAYDGTGWDN